MENNLGFFTHRSSIAIPPLLHNQQLFAGLLCQSNLFVAPSASYYHLLEPTLDYGTLTTCITSLRGAIYSKVQLHEDYQASTTPCSPLEYPAAVTSFRGLPTCQALPIHGQVTPLRSGSPPSHRTLPRFSVCQLRYIRRCCAWGHPDAPYTPADPLRCELVSPLNSASSVRCGKGPLLATRQSWTPYQSMPILACTSLCPCFNLCEEEGG